MSSASRLQFETTGKRAVVRAGHLNAIQNASGFCRLVAMSNPGETKDNTWAGTFRLYPLRGTDLIFSWSASGNDLGSGVIISRWNGATYDDIDNIAIFSGWWTLTTPMDEDWLGDAQLFKVRHSSSTETIESVTVHEFLSGLESGANQRLAW